MAAADSYACLRCGIAIVQRRKDRIPTYCSRTCVVPKASRWDRADRQCERCGTTYTPARPDQRWCSAECRGTAQALKRSGPPKSAQCKRCGEMFVKPRGIGQHHRVYCPACDGLPKPNVKRPCRVQGCDRFGHNRDLCETHRNLQRYGKPCDKCGKLCTSSLCGECRVPQPSTTCCPVRYKDCDVCGAPYVLRDKRERRHCYPHYSKSGLASTYVPRQPRPLTCGQCGATFVAKWKRLCRRCVIRNRRAREGRRNSTYIRWTKRQLRRLAQRDGNRCHLCKKLVRWDVPYTGKGSDLYPSRDHLIPRVAGGSDEMVNLALAHRMCNGRRREVGSAQLRLLG